MRHRIDDARGADHVAGTGLLEFAGDRGLVFPILCGDRLIEGDVAEIVHAVA